MRRYTPKREAFNKIADELRMELKAEVGKCEVCGRKREPAGLACHEIANGSGWRKKALDKRFTVLVVCRYPNWKTGERCHDKVQAETETRQLARLCVTRPDDYDLVAYLQLTRPAAPNRITQAEVDSEIEMIFCEGYAKP